LIWVSDYKNNVIVYDCSSNPMRVSDFYELVIDTRGKRFTALTSLSLTNKATNEFCVIGGSSVGDLIRCPLTATEGFEYKPLIKAHSGEVLQIESDTSSMQLCTLGTDGYIRLWRVKIDNQVHDDFAKVSTHNISISIELQKGFLLTALPLYIRVNFFEKSVSVVIVTKFQAIQIMKIDSENGFSVRYILHGIDEDHTQTVFDISVLPRLSILASIGADRTIKIWDMNTNMLIREIAVPELSESIAFVNDRGDLLVGCPNDVYLLRMEDYLPNSMLLQCVDMDFTDDTADESLRFESEMDFWKIFKSEEQKVEELKEKTIVKEQLAVEEKRVGNLAKMGLLDDGNISSVNPGLVLGKIKRATKQFYQNSVATKFNVDESEGAKRNIRKPDNKDEHKTRKPDRSLFVAEDPFDFSDIKNEIVDKEADNSITKKIYFDTFV